MFTSILIYVLIQHIIPIAKGLSKEDLCSLDPDFGGCSDFTELFYYNRFTGECHEFIFGGCLGNKNSFESKEVCREYCKGMEEEKVCDKKPVRGPCEGFIRRYFFNQETQECEEFIYGGCRGNSNNFRTLTECKEFCTLV